MDTGHTKQEEVQLLFSFNVGQKCIYGRHAKLN